MPQTTMQELAFAALMEAEPDAKVHQVQQIEQLFDAGCLSFDRYLVPQEISIPGRPAKPELVSPHRVPRRRLGSEAGRIGLIHAIAHIEFNAINLALDAIYRFSGLPQAYYSDWLSVAVDEARHFSLLQGRLHSLNAAYGDLAAHNGLWEMALKTDDDCLKRMALVPRVLEARGLDVTPGMIERLSAVGDSDTVEILHVILAEEVGHVEIGSRWYQHLCEERGVDAEKTFAQLMREYYQGSIRKPFNVSARKRSGFSSADMELLEKMAQD